MKLQACWEPETNYRRESLKTMTPKHVKSYCKTGWMVLLSSLSDESVSGILCMHSVG